VSETASTTTRVESVTQLTVSPDELRTLLSGSHIVVDNHILNADNTATYLPPASIDTANFQACDYVGVFNEADIQRLLDDDEKAVLSIDETVELLKDDTEDTDSYFNRVTPTVDGISWDDTETTEPKQLDASEKEHVTMEVTMNVSGLSSSEREAINCIANHFEYAFSEIVAKNRDYGFSFLKTGDKLANSATPFENAVRAQGFGLLTRIGDKHERLIENVYGNGDASVSDDPYVTAIEAANYYHFLALILAEPEIADAVVDTE
jgi:hypothetical protein